MKIGDLIQFAPNWVRVVWSNPAVVIERYPPPDEELWVVYRNGRREVIEEKNYEIKLLSPVKCQENVNSLSNA